MRFRVSLLLLAALLAPGTAQAQHWTPEEQEIIDLNQACWDAWASHSLNRVEATCNEHEDARGWLTSNAAPDRGWYLKNARRWIDAIGSKEDWIYYEVNPLSVRIFNDTALIHFWATRTVQGADSTVKTVSQKQLNIWQKIDGRWTWIGGQATPDPS